MADSSDDDFGLDIQPRRKGAGKGKAVKKSTPKGGNARAAELDAYGLDSLLMESEYDARRAQKVSEILFDTADLDAITSRIIDTEKEKAKTTATEARDQLDNMTILEDNSARVPGAISVLRPSQTTTGADLSFDVPCPTDDLRVLFDALRLAANDPADLEEILQSGLVPWTQQKLGGRAPSEVCRWLLRVVARHESVMVVMAAEHALLGLLAEEDKIWQLRYEDTREIWLGCGAVWLTNERATDGDRDEDFDAEFANMHLARNMKPAVRIIRACLQTGAHNFSNDDMRELMLDLLFAGLDEGVNATCQTEVYSALVAAASVLSAEQNGNADSLSPFVEALCNPDARLLGDQMEHVSFVLLARNVPYEVPGMGDAEVARARGFALRHEVCHHLLAKRFLANTSYATDTSSAGVKRALKALQVLLDDEDDLLEDCTEQAYQRQFTIIALTNELAAGALALSDSGKPDGVESKMLIAAMDGINRRLVHRMQAFVQMSKSLLDLMKSKYTPYLPTASGRQSQLSFAKAADEDADDYSSSNDDHDEDDGSSSEVEADAGGKRQEDPPASVDTESQ